MLMVKEFMDLIGKLFYFILVMYRFLKKWKNLKSLVRELGREKFGNFIKRVNEVYVILCVKQKKILLSFNMEIIQEEVEVYEKWLYVVELEEDFFKQMVKFY